MAKLSCDICGGNLIFIDDLDNLTCEICGVKYSKEAIKLRLANSRENFETSSIVIDSEKEKFINQAEGFVSTQQYDKAVSAYWKLIDKYPDDVEILKRYIDLSVNFHADSINNFTTALNSLKKLSNINIIQYIDTFYKNIMNNTVDIYSMFNGLRQLSSNDFKTFKNLLSNNLSLLFTHEQINKIISTGAENSKYAKYLVTTDGTPIEKGRTRCNYLIANFAFCTTSDPDWCDLHSTVKVKSYNFSDIVESEKKLTLVRKRQREGVCIYCGGKYKGMFLNKICTNCGRKIEPYYSINENTIKIISEVK